MQAQVRRLLAGAHPYFGPPRRRMQQRHPYPQLIRVTPLDDRGHATEEGFVCCGRDLSERGVGFFHPQPVASRRVVLTFSHGLKQSVSILADLDWCRFTRHGWYESGGRLLQVVETPSSTSLV